MSSNEIWFEIGQRSISKHYDEGYLGLGSKILQLLAKKLKRKKNPPNYLLFLKMLYGNYLNKGTHGLDMTTLKHPKNYKSNATSEKQSFKMLKLAST